MLKTFNHLEYTRCFSAHFCINEKERKFNGRIKSGRDPVSSFLQKSETVKLMAKKLAIETEKYKQLQKSALESSSLTSLPDQISVRNDNLAYEIEQCSKELEKLSNNINDKLLELSQDTETTLSKGSTFGYSDKNNPSVQRMKGNVNAALHIKFSEQVTDFQKDVCQIKNMYIDKGRSESGQINSLDSMIELCNEIYASNPLLSEREELDKWNSLDRQMEMFYPKEKSPIQETQPLLEPRESPLFSQTTPVTSVGRMQDVERQEEDLATHCCKSHPFLIAFFVILAIIIGIVAYILIKTLHIWSKQR